MIFIHAPPRPVHCPLNLAPSPLVVVRRKMSAAMSAMAAAPIRAASSRRAPRARTGAKVRAHPESPRRFILSLEGSREPLATNALAAPRGTRRRAGACGSGVPSRPRCHPRDSRLVLVARVDARSFHRRGSSAAARRWRRARAQRTRPSSSRRVGPSREDSRPDLHLLTPPLTPRVSIQTQASKRNLARPAVSDPSQVSVSAPPPTRRPRARRRFEPNPPSDSQPNTHPHPNPETRVYGKKRRARGGPCPAPRARPRHSGPRGTET